LITVQATTAQDCPAANRIFTWDTLPPIPDTIGYAGSFAGVTDNVLIVAGGSNFPHGGTPWNGGVKTWYDKIFVLEKPDGQWKEAGRLPFHLGYGVSVSTPDGLVLAGGSNEAGHTAHVWRLRYRNGKVETEVLPSLPYALANACGALAGDKLLIAGGLARPDAANAENVFLCFDLKEPKSGWKILPSWPGPARMLAVAGTDGKCFYLFSGTQLINGKRLYLTDAWVYSFDEGWKQLADLPFAVVAAPSPACYLQKGFYLFGGDTGADAAKASILKEKHPGFSTHILRYDPSANTWSIAGNIYTNRKPDAVENPNNSIWAPVTTPLVWWYDRIVLPGGEVRPGTRTPNVLVATLNEKKIRS
jgi:N-acetylneuraminate epimerase